MTELQTAIKTGNIVIGKNETLRLLRKGKIRTVFLARNIPKNLKEDIEHLCQLTKTQIVVTDYDNDELGTLSKKLYRISVLGTK